jgi:hypothetical protein
LASVVGVPQRPDRHDDPQPSVGVFSVALAAFIVDSESMAAAILLDVS